jgi:hypothetical protein
VRSLLAAAGALYDAIRSRFRMTGIAWLGSTALWWSLPRAAVIASVLALQPSAVSRVAAQTTPPAPPAPRGDFGGLIDIGGGRRIHLECRGAG